MPETKVVGVRLREDIVKRIDNLIGTDGRNRSEVIVARHQSQRFNAALFRVP